MQITAVIVTYADRFNLLNQVVESCFQSNVSQIIIVDNNSVKSSKIKLKNLQNYHKEKISVLWNNENLGSAKAYKQGLEKARASKSCEYIWLLDDDNKPQKEALKIVLEFWKHKPDDVVSLLSFRPDRQQYKQAVLENNPKLVLGWANSFSGFHIVQKFNNFLFSKKTVNNENIFGEIAYAPYGGMFFHKSLLDEIGYPNEDYFLYSDDHDWSYRITKANKKIFLVLNSIINDIDTSWALIDKKSNTFTKIKNAPPLRVYYNTRNRILFEKNYLITNSFVYTVNRFIFMAILFFFACRSKNFKVFKKAVSDAKNNNLAKFQ
tara:strand:+ start:22042 stop:23004 length:963 start_codon:yes stop_codon:yes gene_type:complete